MSSMKLFLNQEDMDDSETPGMIYHNKMVNGYRVVKRYATEIFKPWMENTLEDYSYLTICMQAYGVGIRLESIRRAVPRSMGSLYWQFNDLWPVFSWSSIDYFGQWKALHYVARHYYENLVLSVQLVRDEIPGVKREFF